MTTTATANRRNAISGTADRNLPNEPNYGRSSDFCRTNPIFRQVFKFCRTNPTPSIGVEKGTSIEDRFLNASQSDQRVFAKRSQCSSKPKPLMNLRAILMLDFRTEILN
jgi:hypothetical protein